MNLDQITKRVIEKFEKRMQWYNPQGEDGHKKWKAFLTSSIKEVVEEVKCACKKIYVDNVDWAEWGISDEKAAKNFEEHYSELSTQPNS